MSKKARVEISTDHMKAELQPVSADSRGVTDLEGVQAELERMGVTFGIDTSLVESWFADETDPESTLVVARGKPAKNGKDGYVKFQVDVSAKPQFLPDSDDKHAVDFRNAMRVPLIQKDALVAELIPPTAGEFGTNIMGNTLSPAPGNSVRIGVGEGVEQKGNRLLATASGTPSFRDNVVAVRQIYEVRGDVNFETGNIQFPGTVIIQGDVLDGFEISAQEHVVVQGMINGAKIQAGGHVQCMGGILGKNKASIQAAHFIEAKFADACFLTCDGDLTITKDLLHCSTNCLGQVKVGGAIIGGDVIALKGVDAGDLGSEVGVKTSISIRKHYRQERAKEAAKALLERANEVNERFKRFVQMPRLSDEELDEIGQDIQKVQGLIQKKHHLDLQIDKYDHLIAELIGIRITVHKTLWPDVILGSPYCKYTPVEKMAGSMSIQEDVGNGTMVVSRGNV